MRSVALALLLIALPVRASAPLDLELHAGASALFASNFYLLGAQHELSVPQRLALGAGVAFGIGAAKELLWDRMLHMGDPSWRDLGADLVGTFSGLFLTWAIDRMLSGPSMVTR